MSVHDPHELSDVVKGTDVVAILTGHDEYFALDAGDLKDLMGSLVRGLCIRG